MNKIAFLIGLMVSVMMPPALYAQEQFWLQVEAQPNVKDAEDRARAYSTLFPDVSGYRLTSGWFAIALGPYDRDTATRRLANLKNGSLIPRDSFLADGRAFGRQYWPDGSFVAPETPVVVIDEPAAPLDPLTDVTVNTLPSSEPTATATDPVVPAEPETAEETLAEARKSEAALSRDDRMSIQIALQWFGFYDSSIDGAFGPGSRKSMAAWQEANGVETTGTLTTMQRDSLLTAYGIAQAELGLETINEEQAGIEITLPMALVQFDHYEPPFAHFAEMNGSGVKVILISEPGDQSTLFGLYDLLQTLEVVPLEGERARTDRSFTITGRNAKLASYSYAELSKGLIKGYMLIWDPQDDERMERVLAAMQSSFKPVGNRALDPGLVLLEDEARKGLRAGLEVRRPALSRTGFYVDDTGMVLTTPEATDSCKRITFDLGTEAEVVMTDTDLGIVLLKPNKRLSPAAVAELATTGVRIGGEIAVSGYSYEDVLPAPTLTFGSYEDNKGLNGEQDLARLSLDALPGDAGGPVIDTAGTVVGMLLPRASDGKRQLPAEVAYIASAPAVAAKLTAAGISGHTSNRQGALAPEDLSELAVGMTVLVSCWR